MLCLFSDYRPQSSPDPFGATLSPGEGFPAADAVARMYAYYCSSKRIVTGFVIPVSTIFSRRVSRTCSWSMP